MSMDDYMIRERDEDIMRTYFDTLKSMSSTRMDVSVEDVVKQIMRQGASRFWVSYEAARRVVSQMCRGIKPKVSNRNKLAMYNELFRRYMVHRERYGTTGYLILSEIIMQPAPSYYMDSFNMRRIVYRGMRRKNEMARRRVELMRERARGL